MNLVKAQAIAKDMPLQELQKYANGFNPEMIPPWVAAGELQAKMDMQKRMANIQGAAQGEQPSVKEQIEQKAGLMAAQGMQQQQAQQQQAQQQPPGPVPPGIPQPEGQPQAMARGGLASIPVNFNLAGGGIVAFNGEDGNSMVYKGEGDQYSAEPLSVEEMGKSNPYARLKAIANWASRNTEIDPETGEATRKLPSKSNAGQKVSPENLAELIREARRTTPQEVVKKAPSVSAERPSPRPAPRQPTIARPAEPQQEGSGLRAAASPFIAEAASLARERTPAPTPEGIIAEQAALAPASMQESAMAKRVADQRARAESEQAMYEKSRPSATDDLIAMLGQAGQYKGLSGLGPAYTAQKRRSRAEDLAQAARQNELLTGVEKGEYEGGKELFGARTKAMDTAQQLFGRRWEANVKAASDLAQVDQSRINNELKMLSEEKLKRLELASRAADRQVQGAGEARKVEYLAKMAKARALTQEGKTAEADKLTAEANDMLSIISGGAATAAERNDIKALENYQSSIRKELDGLTIKPERRAQLEAQLDQSRERMLKLAGVTEGAATSTGATPLPANPTPSNLKVGTVYSTSKGPAKWTGTGFAPV